MKIMSVQSLRQAMMVHNATGRYNGKKGYERSQWYKRLQQAMSGKK